MGVITGGMPGVQRAFARGLGDFPALFNLLPLGNSSNYGVGVDIEAGKDLPERMEIFALIGDIYISIEGGPGVAKEANNALARGAVVLPMMATGGASSGKCEFPMLALRAPFCATSHQWELIQKKNPPKDTARAAVDIIDAFCKHKQLTGSRNFWYARCDCP